jgi:AraC-like DNA-binding protein
MLDSLHKTLQRIQATQTTRMGRAWSTLCGLETRTESSQYYWDGLRRSADPAHPYVVFQYTLDGWGYYVDGSIPIKMLPQMAFTAVIPTDHRYFLPSESPGWTFFYLLLRHPYIVSRIAERQSTAGPVFSIPPTERLLSRALQLFESIANQTFLDEFAEEQALFDFLMDYERFTYRQRYPQQERERLLTEVRAYVLRVLDRPVEITELAAQYGMSRSHFSHHFKTTTGLSPAQFIKQIRLEAASERLAHSNAKLEVIARETGFADANHLCKVFRRSFYLSPGEFRRQMTAPASK